MKTTDTTERGLETLIEKHLCTEEVGYTQAFSTDYDRTLCLNTKQLFSFLEATQPDKLATIRKRGEDKFLKRLSDQIKKRAGRPCLLHAVIFCGDRTGFPGLLIGKKVMDDGVPVGLQAFGDLGLG